MTINYIIYCVLGAFYVIIPPRNPAVIKSIIPNRNYRNLARTPLHPRPTEWIREAHTLLGQDEEEDEEDAQGGRKEKGPPLAWQLD